MTDIDCKAVHCQKEHGQSSIDLYRKPGEINGKCYPMCPLATPFKRSLPPHWLQLMLITYRGGQSKTKSAFEIVLFPFFPDY